MLIVSIPSRFHQAQPTHSVCLTTWNWLGSQKRSWWWIIKLRCSVGISGSFSLNCRGILGSCTEFPERSVGISGSTSGSFFLNCRGILGSCPLLWFFLRLGASRSKAKDRHFRSRRRTALLCHWLLDQPGSLSSLSGVSVSL